MMQQPHVVKYVYGACNLALALKRRKGVPLWGCIVSSRWEMQRDQLGKIIQEKAKRARTRSYPFCISFYLSDKGPHGEKV